MKNFYKISAVSAGFMIGIFTVWFWSQFSQYSFTKATINDVSLLWRVQQSFVVFALPKAKINNDLEVSLAEVVTEKGEKIARLRIKNNRREAVYFSGYGIESPCTSVVKINNEQAKNSCECGTGLGRQILLSGESTVFTIEYLNLSEVREAEFGFYFETNDEKSKLYWSETLIISD